MKPIRPLLGAALALACLLSTPAARAAGVHLVFSVTPTAIAPGDTFLVEVKVNPGDDEFNAFDLFLAYDPTRITYVATTPVNNQIGPLMSGACGNLFHRFTPTPGNLAANLSLLCSNTYVTGPGTIYRVKFLAGPTLGLTNIGCGTGTQFYRAGFYVNPLQCTSIDVKIGPLVGVPEERAAARPRLGPPVPNPARSADATLRLAVNLPAPDAVTLDLFDVAGRRLATREAVELPAGESAIEWPLAGVSPGFYFIRMSTRGGMTAKRSWVVGG